MFLGVPGSFIDPFGNPRTANYDFSISGVTSLVPEPSTTASVAAALLLWLAWAGPRHQKPAYRRARRGLTFSQLT